MPPKKTGVCKVQKGEILFTEAPKDGTVYPYGSPLHSVDNPRCIPTKSVDQTDASWISPQFETTTSMGFQRCQKPQRRQQAFKNKDTSRTSTRVMGRCWKPAAHKFPPLIFEKAKTRPCADETTGHSLDLCSPFGNFAETCNKLTEASGASPVTSMNPKSSSKACMEESCCSPSSHFADPVVFSPPEIGTPGLSSNSGSNGCLPHIDSFTPGPCRSLVCGNNLSNGGVTSVLVKDTPEHEYGVKITWRRRSLLMKYLKKKGVLKTSDIFVKT